MCSAQTLPPSQQPACICGTLHRGCGTLQCGCGCVLQASGGQSSPTVQVNASYNATTNLEHSHGPDTTDGVYLKSNEAYTLDLQAPPHAPPPPPLYYNAISGVKSVHEYEYIGQQN